MNSNLSSLIRRNESGDHVKFQDFGKEIFKQVGQKEGIALEYASSEKPNNIKLEDVRK